MDAVTYLLGRCASLTPRSRKVTLLYGSSSGDALSLDRWKDASSGLLENRRERERGGEGRERMRENERATAMGVIVRPMRREPCARGIFVEVVKRATFRFLLTFTGMRKEDRSESILILGP